ncbi:MAG: protease complex subunit PrcB family protein [Candidatus Syntrophonatronum acetioxidans]|uniref:Protease complex subunit PrcB family protein n=1 Tax=Candidatus Syntrophonatronum acetioxidans TaxID=1795816 RepID=A0A424YGU8_9FIRM|nr:MAG: protease complex subunit PrcB family protein [Candidatus Syntrophonatronum acetioxidans]
MKGKGRKKIILLSLVLSLTFLLLMTATVSGTRSLVVTENGGSLPEEPAQVRRLSGQDRYETSAVLALEAFEEAERVIIARGDDAGGFADGLAAGVLAGVMEVPVLLTRPQALPGSVAEAIETLGGEKALVLGGEAAVYPEVVAELEDKGLSVERIYGATRVETAAEISRAAAEEGELADYACIVNSYAPADSLVAGADAFTRKAPILQVLAERIPSATLEVLEELGLEKVYLVGGNAVISEEVESALEEVVEVEARLAGADRYETSVEFARDRFGDDMVPVLARGADANLADAVGASILERPVIYVRHETFPEVVAGYIDEAVTAQSLVYIVGGTAAVGLRVEAEVHNIILIQEGGVIRMEVEDLPEELQDWGENSKNVRLAQSRTHEGRQYLLATYGMQPTAGYLVEMIEVVVTEDSVEVLVDYTQPEEDEPVAQVITYPYDLLVIHDTERPVKFRAGGDETYIPELIGIEEMKEVTSQTFWVKVFGPAPGEQVEENFTLDGVANTFEGTVLYRLLDEDDEELIEESYTTGAMGDWGYFEEELTVPENVAEGAELTLEVYTRSAKDGSIENFMEIPLVYEAEN